MNWNDKIYEEFRNGKIDAFYKHIYPDILVYASNLLRYKAPYRAEDCVQDAVEAAYRRRNEFTSPAQWRAFIITCVRNRAISIIRHNEAQENYLNHLDWEKDFEGDTLSDFIEVETRIRLFNAINSLPPDLHQIFILNFEEGLKNAEIARQLGIAEITVKKRKSKLLSHLRRILGNDMHLLIALQFFYPHFY